METLEGPKPDSLLTDPDCWDPIEYCRGQISALSFVTKTMARDVHILSIRKAFERAGKTQSLRYALAILDLMREIQDLGHGYWYPTPLRYVPLDDLALLIGISPTRELQRHFAGIRRAGYARVGATAEFSKIPHQDLADWMSAPKNTAAWAELELTKARATIGPTLTSSAVELFGVSRRAACGRSVLMQSWHPARMDGNIAWKGLVLCREALPGYYRHFLGVLDGHRVVGEAPLPSDLSRIKFGLARLAESPITVVVRRGSGTRTLHVFGELPRAERRLFLALGVRQASSIGKAYSFREEDYLTCVDDALTSLGVELRVSNGG